MKHITLLFFSIVAFAFAGYVLVTQVKNLTPYDLGFIGVMVLIGFGLSAAADLKNALTTIAPFLPALRGKDGGSNAPGGGS